MTHRRIVLSSQLNVISPLSSKKMKLYLFTRRMINFSSDSSLEILIRCVESMLQMRRTALTRLWTCWRLIIGISLMLIALVPHVLSLKHVYILIQHEKKLQKKQPKPYSLWWCDLLIRSHSLKRHICLPSWVFLLMFANWLPQIMSIDCMHNTIWARNTHTSRIIKLMSSEKLLLSSSCHLNDVEDKFGSTIR